MEYNKDQADLLSILNSAVKQAEYMVKTTEMQLKATKRLYVKAMLNPERVVLRMQEMGMATDPHAYDDKGRVSVSDIQSIVEKAGTILYPIETKDKPGFKSWSIANGCD